MITMARLLPAMLTPRMARISVHGIRSTPTLSLSSASAAGHSSSGSKQLLGDEEFARRVEEVMDSGDVLDLAGHRVELSTPFKLKGGSVLRISNGIISGHGHSLFQVSINRAGLLELRDVALLHSRSPEREEKSSRGAALYAYRGRVNLLGCQIRSEGGFGVWSVQKAHITLTDCELRDTGRSAVVAFDASQIDLDGTVVANATQHAICARGSSRVVVRRSRLERAELRAVYCYHSACLDMSDSVVSGTLSDEAAAVQVDALRPGDSASLRMERVTFDGNAGGDFAVCGNVERHIGAEVRAVERTEGVTHAASSARIRDERRVDARGRLRTEQS